MIHTLFRSVVTISLVLTLIMSSQITTTYASSYDVGVAQNKAGLCKEEVLLFFLKTAVHGVHILMPGGYMTAFDVISYAATHEVEMAELLTDSNVQKAIGIFVDLDDPGLLSSVRILLRDKNITRKSLETILEKFGAVIDKESGSATINLNDFDPCPPPPPFFGPHLRLAVQSIPLRDEYERLPWAEITKILHLLDISTIGQVVFAKTWGLWLFVLALVALAFCFVSRKKRQAA